MQSMANLYQEREQLRNQVQFDQQNMQNVVGAYQHLQAEFNAANVINQNLVPDTVNARRFCNAE